MGFIRYSPNGIECRKVDKKSKILSGLGYPFYFLWCGETVSLIGTSLMKFALGVWVYQKTGSVMDFSAVIVSVALPQLLAMPFTGSIADRFDIRYVIIAADVATALLTLMLAWFLLHNILEVGHLYIFNMLVSLVGAFRMPAYSASVRKLLPLDKLAQASGLMGISFSLLTMFAPMAAGGLMTAVGLPGIVCIDIIAFCIGSLFVLKAFLHLDKYGNKLEPADCSTKSSTLSVAKAFFKREPIMLGLLFYSVVQQGLIALVSTMIMPMVLSNYSEKDLGIILSCGSLGGLLGAALLTAMSHISHLMIGVLIGDAILAFCIMLAGISTSFVFYCACAFVALFASGFAECCGRTLWMKKVPNQYQGRILSIGGGLVLLVSVFVIFCGGIVGEKILEPAFAEGGGLVMTIGSWIGTGKGRGMGFMFIICGSVGFIVALSALATKLSRLDFLVADSQ